MRNLIFTLALLLPLLAFSSPKNKNKPLWNEVRYEAGACFPPCKSFILIIDKKGRLMLNAKQGLRWRGQYIRKITKKESVQLNTLLETINISKLRPDYNSGAEDTQLKVLSYRMSPKIDKTFRYKGALPRLLIKVDSLMIGIAEANNWQKIK